MADSIAEGQIDAHVKQMKPLTQQQRTSAAKTLKTLKVEKTEESMKRLIAQKVLIAEIEGKPWSDIRIRGGRFGKAKNAEVRTSRRLCTDCVAPKTTRPRLDQGPKVAKYIKDPETLKKDFCFDPAREWVIDQRVPRKEGFQEIGALSGWRSAATRRWRTRARAWSERRVP
ncbi:unnamed protein product [Prorocentrum cordatum]|uniref:Uncharacterized protein n=1 Tax=Prorocentrum cordatum TaxID=2364126 RepID=A0ABN9SSX1_9DINO|nr:unnamed protein product [Polarella glacialis]